MFLFIIFPAGSHDHALYIGSYISQRQLCSALFIQSLYIYSRVSSAYDTHLQHAVKLQMQTLYTGKKPDSELLQTHTALPYSKRQRCMPHSAWGSQCVLQGAWLLATIAAAERSARPGPQEQQ